MEVYEGGWKDVTFELKSGRWMEDSSMQGKQVPCIGPLVGGNLVNMRKLKQDLIAEGEREQKSGKILGLVGHVD